jgi:hypothetical protein
MFKISIIFSKCLFWVLYFFGFTEEVPGRLLTYHLYGSGKIFGNAFLCLRETLKIFIARNLGSFGVSDYLPCICHLVIFISIHNCWQNSSKINSGNLLECFGLYRNEHEHLYWEYLFQIKSAKMGLFYESFEEEFYGVNRRNFPSRDSLAL